MDALHGKSRFSLTLILAIAAIHCALVPIAIAITLQLYGVENGLSIRNQATWMPIINAQTSLLVLLLVFGTGNASLRGGLFSLGMCYVLMSIVWAYSMLGSFRERDIYTWIGQLKTTSIVLLLPSLVSAILLMPLRVILGTANRETNVIGSKFRISDLLIVTFLIAAILSWYQFVMTDHPRRAVNIQSLATSTAFKIVIEVGCFVLVLSRKWWWLGGIVFVVSLVAHRMYLAQLGLPSTYIKVVYPWIIVASTLAAFRLMGFRLQREIQTSA